MSRRPKRHSPEQIIRKLRDADAMLAGGVSRPEALYTQIGFSQLQGNCPAHASAGAGDQGDFIFQLHDLPLYQTGVNLNAAISRERFGRV